MLQLNSQIQLFLYEHGSHEFADELRDILQNHHLRSLAFPYAESLLHPLQQCCSELPKIHAVILETIDGIRGCAPCDPCDVLVEALRQADQQRLGVLALDQEMLPMQLGDFPRPDPEVLRGIGDDQFIEIWGPILEQIKASEFPEWVLERFTFMAEQLRSHPSESILLCLPYSYLQPFVLAWNLHKNLSLYSPQNTIISAQIFPVHPNHLYFTLGELPFYTAEYEKARHSLFEEVPKRNDLVKKMLISARRDFANRALKQKISIAQIQKILDFALKMAWRDLRRKPSLVEWLIAAQSIAGGEFAVQVLEAAKNYPFFDLVDSENWLKLGPNQSKIPEVGHEWRETIQLFHAQKLEWKNFEFTLPVTSLAQEQFKKITEGRFSCSHIPEDIRIERFNKNIRSKAMELLNGEPKSHPFTTSLMDGLDIRETLRSWHTGELFVKEIPQKHKKVDTVVILFDTDHDELYPTQTVWFAEHPEESTLTFYGTDPMDKIVGPGIGECNYGGLSLLFPPTQDVFNPFDDQVLDYRVPLNNLSERLMWGALGNTRTQAVALAANQKPSSAFLRMAKFLNKEIVYIPLSQFNPDDLAKLRRMHMLEGHSIRSFAQRFIL